MNNINKIISRAVKISRSTIGGIKKLTTDGVLEMTLILDLSLPYTDLNEYSCEILTALRKEGSPFNNLRINLIKLHDSEIVEKYVISYSDVLMGRVASSKDSPWLEADDTKNVDTEHVDTEHVDTEHVSEHIISAQNLDALLSSLNKYYSKNRLFLMLTGCDHSLSNIELKNEEWYQAITEKVLCVYPDGKHKVLSSYL